MVTCDIDHPHQQAEPPTQKTIEQQRQQQMKALINIRRLLLESKPIVRR